MTQFQAAVSAIRDDFIVERANMKERADEDGDFDEHERRRFSELQDTIDVMARIVGALSGATTQGEALAVVKGIRADYDTMSRENDGEILGCIRALDAVWQAA